MNHKETFSSSDGVTLKELLSAEIGVLRTLIEANDKSYQQQFLNVTNSTQSALASADRAVTKAEAATEKRFENVNEFRNTLSDQQRTFIPRAEFEVIVKAIQDKIDALNMSTIARQSEGVGQKTGMGTIVMIIGVISTFLLLVGHLITGR